MNMVNSQVMMKFIAEINIKIEQRLKALLSLIMEKDVEEEERKIQEEQKIEESVNLANSEGNVNATAILSNNLLGTPQVFFVFY